MAIISPLLLSCLYVHTCADMETYASKTYKQMDRQTNRWMDAVSICFDLSRYVGKQAGKYMKSAEMP